MDASSASALSPERPFPGLRPFSFADHDFFFGRKAQFYALYRLMDVGRFVAVVGSSGSGKSSLVRAGLLPILQQESDELGGRNWRFLQIRPGDAPLDQLTEALISLARTVSKNDDPAIAAAREDRIRYQLRKSSFGLAAALDEIKGLDGDTTLLVVDQFEELFRFASGSRNSDQHRDSHLREEATQFVRLLLEGSRTSDRDLRVLLTMRSDFIGDCARFQGLPEAVSATQFLVPSLTRDEREQAIRGPLRVAGATIDSMLVEQLLNDSSDELDQLPVLQHCLLRLWQSSSSSTGSSETGNRHLTSKHYDDIGRMAHALSEHADEILTDLHGLELTVEQTFRALSEFDKEGRATRRALPFEQLLRETGAAEDDLRKVVDRFRADDCSFLTPASSAIGFLDRKTRVDVGHEALLRRWTRVAGEPGATGVANDARSIGWLRQEERDGRRYQALLSFAEGRSLPLDQVAQQLTWWSSRPRTEAWAERYGGGHERVERLLKDSQAEFEADVRHKKEEANKEQERFAFQVRMHRRMQLATLVVSALLVISLGFGVWALTEREHVLKERQRAETSFLAALDQSQKLFTEIKEALDKGAVSGEVAMQVVTATKDALDELQKTTQTPALNVVRVQMLFTVSDILANQRETKQALTQVRFAETLAKDLQSHNHPDAPPLVYGAAFRIADLVTLLDNSPKGLEEGLQEYQRAQRIARQLATEHPDNGARLYDLAFVTNKVGETFQEQGNFPAALEQFAAALADATKVAAIPSARVEWRAYPGSTLTKIASALAKQPKPDFAAASKKLDAAIDLQELLRKDVGWNNILESNISTTHRTKADILVAREDYKSAFREYETSIQILKELLGRDATNAEWLVKEAAIYHAYASAAEMANQSNLATRHFGEEVTILQALVNKDRTNRDWQEKLTDAKNKLKGVPDRYFLNGSSPPIKPSKKD